MTETAKMPITAMNPEFDNVVVTSFANDAGSLGNWIPINDKTENTKIKRRAQKFGFAELKFFVVLIL